MKYNSTDISQVDETIKKFGNLYLKAQCLNAMPSMDQNIPGLHINSYGK